MTWVTIRKHAEATGYSEDAIRQKIAKGVWVEGLVYRRAPDGRVLISEEGYQAWVEQTQACAPQVKRRSRSISAIAESVAKRS